MATYNQQYKWNPPRRKKQRYALVERVVDFSKAPQTSGMANADADPNSSVVTTAWAAGDILQAVQIRAGQTVLGVEFELMIVSNHDDTVFKIGYGANPDYWGSMYAGKRGKIVRVERVSVNKEDVSRATQTNFGRPVYFSSADTIDIKINEAITVGKVRLIVHLLEDDR